jgi:hypothetical protein
MEDNIQMLLDAAAEEGFDIALSSWAGPGPKACLQAGRRLDMGKARSLAVGADGSITITNTSWMVSGHRVGTMPDFANMAAVSNYVTAWATELLKYSNYSYFFFNEPALQNPHAPYTDSPTYSSNGLAWFRQFVMDNCGATYPDPKEARFPLCPVNRHARGLVATTGLSENVAGILELTADPGKWAAWWEWRNLVFANLMHAQARFLHYLNARNPNWIGTICFISHMTPWTPKCGIDLGLIAGIPHIDFMVMEQQRVNSHGGSAHREEEVQLQLRGLKDLLTNGTAFGSYVMLHTYHKPRDDGSFTYNIGWMTQDLARALSPEFDAAMVVPYGATLLVDQPDRVSAWQNAHYVPEAAEAWNAARFHDAWEPITDLRCTPGGQLAANGEITFCHSRPEKAEAFVYCFSTSSAFRGENRYVMASSDSTCFTYAATSGTLPSRTPIYWRVRGRYPVRHIAEGGSIRSTSHYYGAWSAADGWFTLAQQDDLAPTADTASPQKP